jgi:acetyltransferase
MAIHPYPRQLVAQHVLADGTRIMIRPIRPEDAVLEREFVNGLSERARYLRFMHPLKEITPPMVSRFTQIDYDREMALVAIAGESADEREVGVARYVGNADGRGCEFAIVVADAWQGRGIATELLRRLIAVARARRFELMEGIVLAQNRGMLVLAEELGFATEPVPDDASLVRVTLRL